MFSSIDLTGTNKIFKYLFIYNWKFNFTYGVIKSSYGIPLSTSIIIMLIYYIVMLIIMFSIFKKRDIKNI